MARPPLIGRDVATRAALDLIDAEGLSAFSMERLGKWLAVTPSTLYYHFKGKTDILRSVVRLILTENPVAPDDVAGGWEDFMIEMTVRLRTTILKHPNAAPLLLEYYPRQLTASAYERCARVLEGAGVPLVKQLMIFDGMERLTLASAMFSAARGRVPGDEHMFGGLDRRRHPLLTEVVALNPWDSEELFVESMRSFLRGAVGEARSAT